MTCMISRPPVGRLVHLIVGNIVYEVDVPGRLNISYDFPHALCFSVCVSLFFLCFFGSARIM